MSQRNSILDFISRLISAFSGKPATSQPQPPPPPAVEEEFVSVVHPRVLVINFDPVVDAQGTHLTQRMNWNNVDDLIAGCIADIDEVSYGLVKYRVVERIDVNEFPQKAKDAFRYTTAQYIDVIEHRTPAFDPDGVDYWKIVDDFNLIPRVMNNEFDEVWLFGGPYFGFYESRMVGKHAIWCNAPALENSDHCTRRFVIMGYNYERKVDEMIHDIGHRAESIMAQVHGSFDYLQWAYKAVDPREPPVDLNRFANPSNLFERFILYEKIAPGRSETGLVHTPPNADKDYDWANPNTVSSACDDWLNFPDLQGTRRMLNCDEWGAGDVRGHHKWWFKRLPHVQGKINGVSNNWWKYVIEVDHPDFDRLPH